MRRAGALAADTPVFKQNGIALYTDERNAQALAAGGRQFDAGELARRAFRPHPRRRLFRPPGLSRSQRGAHPRRCRSCASRCATASASPPACNSARASCTRPARPTRAARIPACSCRSRRTTRPTCDIPGRKASFGVIEAAQARGDLRVLARARPARACVRMWRTISTAGLAALGEAARAALAMRRVSRCSSVSSVSAAWAATSCSG